MDDRQRNGKPTTETQPDQPPYEVGYRKPPKQHRFKAGQSGNPTGRSRGKRPNKPSLNVERMKGVILEEAYRTIMVRDGDRAVDIPVIQAILRSVALSAAKGHQRSQRMFTDLLQCVERENKAFHDSWLETAIGYKIDGMREVKRREKLGIPTDDMLPHPDQVIIDMVANTATITGPITPEEKAIWDQGMKIMSDCDRKIRRLERRLEKDPDNSSICEEIELHQKIRRRIAQQAQR